MITPGQANHDAEPEERVVMRVYTFVWAIPFFVNVSRSVPHNDSAEKTPCFEKPSKNSKIESSIESSRIGCGRFFWSDRTVLVVFSTVTF
jgi:hypothetical protein